MFSGDLENIPIFARVFMSQAVTDQEIYKRQKQFEVGRK